MDPDAWQQATNKSHKFENYSVHSPSWSSGQNLWLSTTSPGFDSWTGRRWSRGLTFITFKSIPMQQNKQPTKALELRIEKSEHSQSIQRLGCWLSPRMPEFDSGTVNDSANQQGLLLLWNRFNATEQATNKRIRVRDWYLNTPSWPSGKDLWLSPTRPGFNFGLGNILEVSSVLTKKIMICGPHPLVPGSTPCLWKKM